VVEASGDVALLAEYAFALYMDFGFPFGFSISAFLSKARHLFQAFRVSRAFYLNT
jgi:hypothetical protein